ncbi:UxaA family hydrolase [Catenovulum agarivorans]|uniref:UxaA family hydrolase n=1 Tax=Catenovulum agarivorans TaxID=1172192 RepID=UPI0002E32993|nr:altronate dehydratase family protein [Catenovulum agarivorans]
MHNSSSASLAVQVHPNDNVAVAVAPLSKGQTIEISGTQITLAEDISQGHKLSLTSIKQGDDIFKYGYSIGQTTADIAAGQHVHSHNLRTKLDGSETYQYQAQLVDTPTQQNIPTFNGYLRGNGKVGIRNEIWIINTVGCVNQAAKKITDICKQKYAGQADDFIALTHPFGCSQLGDDLSNTKTLLSSLMQNPNAGGVVMIGLGCENNQLKKLIADLPDIDTSRFRYYNSQEVMDEIQTGVDYVAELLELMATDKRTTQPVSKLALGMKCGGSDGFSGITANAIVGRVTDILTQYGGRVILTETPEMFGAEQVLMNRAVNTDIFEKIVKLVSDFKQYFIANNQPVYENPSPGNKAGGLTTLEEKSLGAIQKGGRASINQVIDYGQIATLEQGLTLLQAPGNDAVSSTALAAAGANMVLFTTGRGTPLGFPIPTVKISSNSGIAERKPHWIDFNAGEILDKGISVDDSANALFEYILRVASGEQTNNEKNDNREIGIWKSGVTL